MSRRNPAIVIIIIISLILIVVTAPLIFRAKQGPQINSKPAATKPLRDEKQVLLSKIGMVCISCRAAVTAILSKTDGVTKFSIDLKKDEVTVTYNPARTNPEIIRVAIIKGGYKVGGLRELN